MHSEPSLSNERVKRLGMPRTEESLVAGASPKLTNHFVNLAGAYDADIHASTLLYSHLDSAGV
jgi:hypothetical protein